jgi:secondary thiamine-phosphate synthase enzyme
LKTTTPRSSVASNHALSGGEGGGLSNARKVVPSPRDDPSGLNCREAPHRGAPADHVDPKATMLQRHLSLRARTRGFHLITDEIIASLPELRTIKTGVLHLFIQHTSASLTINENASPDVRSDMERHFMEMVPEDAPYYEHTYEGPDDMPAHIKASLLGAALSIPIGAGALLLGTWQGIYLGEHRNQAGPRRVVATIIGE